MAALLFMQQMPFHFNTMMESFLELGPMKTAKLFATKEIQSMLGVAFTFTGKQADEMYEYLHRVRQEIDNL